MKTDAEIIKINIINSQLKAFDDENLKEKSIQIGRLEIHVAVVDIGKDEPETLATNLTYEKFTTEYLKELYNKIWSVETGFGKLKNI